MKKIVKIAVASAWVLPFLAMAQTTGFDSSDYIGTTISRASTWINNIVTLLVALSIAWFIWGVISYTMSSDEEKKKAAKSQMIWGVIAIAVIVSIWGLVYFLQGIFGVGTGTGAGDVLPDDFIPTVSI